jgi:hypothetical protein
LSEKYHCARTIKNAIIVIGIIPRPRYASTLRNTAIIKPRIAKQRIILMVRPLSLLCHDGVLEIELNCISNCTVTTFNYLLD